MKRAIKFGLSIGYANADQEEVVDIELPDDATIEQQDAEIEKQLGYWADQFIEVWYEDADEELGDVKAQEERDSGG